MVISVASHRLLMQQQAALQEKMRRKEERQMLRAENHQIHLNKLATKLQPMVKGMNIRYEPKKAPKDILGLAFVGDVMLVVVVANVVAMVMVCDERLTVGGCWSEGWMFVLDEFVEVGGCSWWCWCLCFCWWWWWCSGRVVGW